MNLRRRPLLCAIVLSTLCTLPLHALAQHPEPLRAYFCFVHWVSMGNTDLALQQFTDDAVVVAGPLCTQLKPCVGKDAIRVRYLSALNTGQAPLPLSDQRFDGRTLRTHGETIFQADPQGRVAVLRGGHAFDFRDGRIASLHVELDLGDPPTAAFIERRTAEALDVREGPVAVNP
jgi:hypothetical protein